MKKVGESNCRSLLKKALGGPGRVLAFFLYKMVFSCNKRSGTGTGICNAFVQVT